VDDSSVVDERVNVDEEVEEADMGSELVVRLIEMGPVSGLKSFLAVVDWKGLGLVEGDEDILSLQEESSRSASGLGVGRDTYCCFRGEGDCREETEATGFGFGFEVADCRILSDLSLGRAN
jgi:hypothetical protein